MQDSGRLIRWCVSTLIDQVNETLVLWLPPPHPTASVLETSAKKLPSLPKEIGLLIPIILIIEHSNEKWRRFNLTNWPQEWACVCVGSCVRTTGTKKTDWRTKRELLVDRSGVRGNADGGGGKWLYIGAKTSWLRSSSVFPSLSLVPFDKHFVQRGW